MPYYPAFLNLAARPCLVIGGGRVGLDKVTGLLNAGAAVTVISPTLEPTLREWTAAGRVRHLARPYQDGDMGGFTVVLVATDDRTANATISAEGHRRGIWVNCADDPAHCDFILPSVIRRGPVTIGISTGGGSPAMARRMREELTDYFTEDFEGLADMLAEVRGDLRRRGLLAGIDPETWQRAIDGPLRALLAQRRWGQAKARLLARLGIPLQAAVAPDAALPSRPAVVGRAP